MHSSIQTYWYLHIFLKKCYPNSDISKIYFPFIDFFQSFRNKKEMIPQMQRAMETRLNASHTYVSIRVPTRRTGREERTRSSIHTLARRSGHFGRNPGCGTPLSYSSSCLEPVYARQVSSRRPLNRPFQVLRACSARLCMCEWNTGLEGASLPPPMSQNGTERERFACSFPSLSFSPRFLLFHFHGESFDLNDR